MSRPTLMDVARDAGVSRATAARVLAGSAKVDERMTAAVLRVASELGYQTNVAARSLRSGRTGSVGLIVAVNELDTLGGTFVAAVMKGVMTALGASRVQPVLLPADGRRPEVVAGYLSAKHVDGAVVILQHEIADLVTALRDVPVPLVWVGRPEANDTADPVYVDADNYGGGRIAARALLEAGRRTLGIIAGPADMQAAGARLRGWRDELADWAVPSDALAHGDFTLPGGATAMARLLARHPHLDGVFASSDLMAVGALRVLQASGRGVPSDVSVVGFDDTLVAATSEPPLTSVRQPLQEMGTAAGELLLRRLEQPAFRESTVLPTSLVLRESL